MDKNKWIEENVKEIADIFLRQLLTRDQIESFLRQSLEEAWDKGRDEVNQAEGNI